MSSNVPERAFPYYLLTGLVGGVLLGLFVSWAAFPAESIDASPAELRSDFKESFRSAIALSFASSGDIGRAEARLALLGERDPIRKLTEQAQIALLNQQNQREARALGQLAEALGQRPSAFSGDVNSAAIIVADSAYEVLEQQEICEADESRPLLKIFILDQEGLQTSGDHIRLHSGQAEEETFTGLRPEYGPNYAEFALTPGVSYSLEINQSGVVQDLAAHACVGEGGESFWGTWLYTLQVK